MTGLVIKAPDIAVYYTLITPRDAVANQVSDHVREAPRQARCFRGGAAAQVDARSVVCMKSHQGSIPWRMPVCGKKSQHHMPGKRIFCERRCRSAIAKRMATPGAGDDMSHPPRSLHRVREHEELTDFIIATTRL